MIPMKKFVDEIQEFCMAVEKMEDDKHPYVLQIDSDFSNQIALFIPGSPVKMLIRVDGKPWKEKTNAKKK